MQGFSFGSPTDISMHKNVKSDLDFISKKGTYILQNK